MNFPHRRLPFFHVVLAHLLVVLMLLTPCTQAGDILRMGGSSSGATTATGTPATDAATANAATATAQAHANAQDMLARNTMALQAVDAMQQAAQAAAAGASNAGANPNFPGQTLPNVPNGLGTGGLDIIGTPTGANAPQQSLENAHTIVTIQQTQQQALLNWKTFNVGSDTTVRFDQSAGGADAGNWIAFNKITDPSGNPTQILGSIEAQGQVYLINQNGIIFGGGSQVNTHTLVASSLPINDNLISRGLLNNPDSQFLFSANAQAAGTKGPTPAYTPPALPNTPGNKIGNVTVQAGARITSPTSSANVGGRVVLVGPNVENNGTISTPDGQTILAAGMEVGFAAHPSSDASLRGLDVYIGSVGSYGGTATNAGMIDAPRGSVAIAGKSANQNGIISSTTTAALNGRIDIKASYDSIPNSFYDPTNRPADLPFLQRSTGVVTFAASTVTQILPEWNNPLTVVGTELALKSQINITGQTVYLGTNSTVYAPNATVAISAGVWAYTLSTAGSINDMVHSTGQVYADAGAVIDVQGSTDIEVPLDQYILTVTLRAAELANAPLQRNSFLRGQTITVDLRNTGTRADGTVWYGTPLADLTGYVGIIQRTVGELTTAGGSVTIAAGGSVVLQPTSRIDVSGGWINYQGSDVQTTRLLVGGQVVDISQADPSVAYDAIYTGAYSSTDARYNITETSAALWRGNAYYAQGYVSGGAGGALSITAPAMALDGRLLGLSVSGPLQAASLVTPASLSLKWEADLTSNPTYFFNSPTPPAIQFSSTLTQTAADAFTVNANGAAPALRQDRRDTVVLSPTLLSEGGFGRLSVINYDGSILLAAGETLQTTPLGSISLSGANVSILGSIIAPGGSISLTAYNISPAVMVQLRRTPPVADPAANAGRGLVTVGSTSVLSTAGLAVNQSLASASQLFQPLVTKGGSISVHAYDVDIAQGSVFDVSGGVRLSTTNQFTYGNAGSITIAAAQNPVYSYLSGSTMVDVQLAGVTGGHLNLGAQLKGYSGATGGTLSVQAQAVQIGGSAGNAQTLVLAPGFFSSGGFTQYNLTAFGMVSGGDYSPAIAVTAGTAVVLQAQVYVAVKDPSGSGALTLVPTTTAEGVRKAASLSFNAPGVNDDFSGLLQIRSDIVMAAGSSIVTDALGSVRWTAQTGTVLGSIIAPGGSIDLSFATKYPTVAVLSYAQPTGYFGANAVLSTAGKTVLLPDAYGRNFGSVHDGGTVKLTGNLVLSAGSLIDVSGTTGVIDVYPQYVGTGSSVLVTNTLNQLTVQTVRVDSDGGAISLNGSEELFVDGTLKGSAGGASAQGGSLTVGSGRFYLDGTDIPDPRDINLWVTQSGPTLPAPVTGLGTPVKNSSGAVYAAAGYLAADSFQQGGFDSLTLKGNVGFLGPVNITARGAITVGSGGIIQANDAVNLTASYVMLGRAFLNPQQPQEIATPYTKIPAGGGAPDFFYFSPTHGTGSLTVTAKLIDVGTLSLQNTGLLNLQAYDGEIRGDGVLDVAGDIRMTAAQIYPPTATSFQIVAYDYTVGAVNTAGSITIIGSGQHTLPLSAGGTLSLYATKITQGGTLVAPFGTINLGWDGIGGWDGGQTAPTDLITHLTVPVTSQLTLTAGSVTSVSAVDLLTGQALTIPYGVNLNGTTWIDPRGIDITSGGGPTKAIHLAGLNLTTEQGSVIDVAGGGDLYAYRWVTGNGGTSDVLAADTSFAVIANYAANYAPFGAYNTSTTAATNLGTDTGYTNSTLHVGDQVYLEASSGLAAGVYTLLPARYALLSGGFLVTPSSATPVGSLRLPTGATQVNGYRIDGLNADAGVPALFSSFEVAPGSVVRTRAQYDEFTASVFLKSQATLLGVTMPELPPDAGHAVLQAVQTMTLQGTVLGQAATGGNGALVDISSPVDIVISAPGAAAVPGKLQLNAASLSSIGAGSLLIGGLRSTASDGTHITVRTNNLTVDDSGTPLSGPEILLVANQVLTVKPGSVISQSSGSTVSGAETLILGSASTAGSGNGALLRVSSNANATITRLGRTTSTIPTLVIGAGAVLQGESITLDTTYGTQLDPTAALNGAYLSLNSGSVTLQLDSSVSVPATQGLLLTGAALQSLSTARSLSLLSYTTFDTYGAGTVGNAALNNLAIHAGQIRGFSQGTGTVAFVAQNILLDNSANGSTATAGGSSGTLAFTTSLLRLGSGALQISQFDKVQIQAAAGIQLEGTGGISTAGAATLTTPSITGLAGATQAITAGGALLINGSNAAPQSPGLGVSLTLQGLSVQVDTNISVPSGSLTAVATGGSLTVNGTLNAAGQKVIFQDVSKYTNGGQISLTSSTGNVTLGAGSVVTVSASSGGGNAGFLNISAPQGIFSLSNTAVMSGTGGTGGINGSFTLDVDHLGTLMLSQISGTASASFTESLSARVRTGSVTISDSIKAHQFQLAADSGGITVSGTGRINASGTTGGSIRLVARQDVVLNNGATLTVAAQTFDAAGKGGQVSLEAGAAAMVSGTYAAGTGTVDVQSGSSIDLSVAALTAGSGDLGQFSGTLHLRAPQITGGTDVSVNAIQGTIIGASSVTVEGYYIQDLTSSGGVITTTVQNNVKNNGNTFLGAGYTAMYNRIVGSNPLNSGLGAVLVLQPGAEIINRTGDLTLGTTSSTTTSDWNLSTFRFGTKAAPGVLTLRAAGNLVFYNALSDGFTPTVANTDATWLWQAPVTTQVSTLPVNTQSYSYRLTAGADLSAVDFHGVQALSQLGANSGSLQLGKNGGQAMPTTLGSAAQTSTAISNKLYQVIRTGTGDIDISAGRDVQLLNQFATIYTAGVGVKSATHVFADNDFVMPLVIGGPVQQPAQAALGSVQQQYAASYTMGGGNVLVYAQNDIVHLTRNSSNVLIADSERQMPVNWLYRRGFVDTATGLFGAGGTTGTALTTLNDPSSSTSWWVDFSNFFEGVGALGGGNVALKAGRDVANVDAVAPTNARMPGKDPATGLNVAPNASKLLELGGGNVTVTAGRNVDGGVYYVERGQGVIQAGNSITTNSTRTLSLGLLSSLSNPLLKDSSTWLPTTLFVGKGSWDVRARLDVLLGPVANPFLLPQGLNNRFWNKTYFTTYSSTSAVNAASAGGTVTLRETVNPGGGSADPILYRWFFDMLMFDSTSTSKASYYQPWIRLDESSVEAFRIVSTLLPPTLTATSFSSSINLVGSLTLFPSATGTINLLAAKSINGLLANGTSTTLVPGKTVVSWGSSTINLSDANPASVPGVATPFAYTSIPGIGKTIGTQNVSQSSFLSFIDSLFKETGVTSGSAAVLQTKQALHAPGILHAADTTPVYVYANSGDISGITLYSAKAARVIAGNDVTDISLYIQNTTAASLTIVAAGRDITAYNDNTTARTQTRLTGNALVNGQAAMAGDIQINGGGTLEVIAGRNINLGTGVTNANGTGAGITSIGNGRNPYLPFAGANVIVAAGAGAAAAGLGGMTADFASFINYISTTAAGARYLGELAEALGVPSINLNDPTLTPEQQKQLALAVFYLALRDAGRDHNDPDSPNAGTYTEGYAAISKLLPTTSTGSIQTQTRSIRTKSGGDISILAPNGGLQLATSTIGSTLAPPGIITESGGSISIFANQSVEIGVARIFTLRGGDITIWSSTGDIAAGSSSKTVQSAPPTRVLIDPQSANVATDLAGLATGGGIGVLATVAGVKPGNVDLIAPIGAVDAGDAGIRATGNLNIAATIVLNAANISVGGTSAGTPAAPSVAAPSLGGLASAASSAGAASTATASQNPNQGAQQQALAQEKPSDITVEVIGYGGSGGDDERKRNEPGE